MIVPPTGKEIRSLLEEIADGSSPYDETVKRLMYMCERIIASPSQLPTTVFQVICFDVAERQDDSTGFSERLNTLLEDARDLRDELSKEEVYRSLEAENLTRMAEYQDEKEEVRKGLNESMSALVDAYPELPGVIDEYIKLIFRAYAVSINLTEVLRPTIQEKLDIENVEELNANDRRNIQGYLHIMLSPAQRKIEDIVAEQNKYDLHEMLRKMLGGG